VPSLTSKAFVALLPNMTSPAAALNVSPNVMTTGLHSRLGDWWFVEWQGLREVTCWNQHAEVVTGASDGLQFAAGLTAADSLDVFVPELFRKAKLNATGTVCTPTHTCLYISKWSSMATDQSIVRTKQNWRTSLPMRGSPCQVDGPEYPCFLN
jgi:hypothetical protein